MPAHLFIPWKMRKSRLAVHDRQALCPVAIFHRLGWTLLLKSYAIILRDARYLGMIYEGIQLILEARRCPLFERVWALRNLIHLMKTSGSGSLAV